MGRGAIRSPPEAARQQVIDKEKRPILADFWAAALQSKVEDPSALIERLLAPGQLGVDAVLVHHGRQTFEGFAATRHPDDPFDQTSGVGHGRRLLFQEVPEDEAGKTAVPG